MPTHKQDLSVLSINQLQMITGKAYNTIKTRLAGLEPVKKDGRTMWFDPVQALAKIYAEKAEPEKDRLDRLRADQVEFDLAVKRADFAPINVLAYAAADISSQIHRIFEGIPNRIKNSLPTLRAREIKILEREIVKAQNAAAQIQVAFHTTDSDSDGRKDKPSDSQRTETAKRARTADPVAVGGS